MTKMTDGERIAIDAMKRQHGDALDSAFQVELAKEIDSLIRRRMAEAWKEGWRRAWETPRVWTGDVPGNPYQGRKRKT
jgi:hypothetical protein